MAIELARPTVHDLAAIDETLRSWQVDGSPVRLHPGDLGWFWRFGPEATAAAVRTWSRQGRMLAVGLLDGADQLRLTTAPEARRDIELAASIADDIVDPELGVLPTGRVAVETPGDALLGEELAERGWKQDEGWTPLRRDLSDPVEDARLRLETIGPGNAADWALVQQSAFSLASSHPERWFALAEGPAYAQARGLLARADDGSPAAAIIVWSAGPERPGLIEPMGVHADHRGRGYGRAITLAGAAALRELGSSSVEVITNSSNVAAVATYSSAGLVPGPERFDRYREH